MTHDYCISKCKIGLDKSRELLDANNSPYDAAFDFSCFIDECFKTCPYREQIGGSDT